MMAPAKKQIVAASANEDNMPRARAPSRRRLPDGSLLHNRLLTALPRAEYDRILQYVRMTAVATGHTLHAV